LRLAPRRERIITGRPESGGFPRKEGKEWQVFPVVQYQRKSSVPSKWLFIWIDRTGASLFFCFFVSADGEEEKSVCDENSGLLYRKAECNAIQRPSCEFTGANLLDGGKICPINAPTGETTLKRRWIKMKWQRLFRKQNSWMDVLKQIVKYYVRINCNSLFVSLLESNFMSVHKCRMCMFALAMFYGLIYTVFGGKWEFTTMLFCKMMYTHQY
jgi:hypothetical protein